MDFKSISLLSGSLVVPTSGVPIIASEVRGYTPSNLLSFLDLTDSILENNPDYNIYEKISPISGVYPHEYILPEKFRGYSSGSLIVTDRSVESQFVDFNLPLFYEYQLMYDSYLMDPSLPDGFLIIRKNFESLVNPDNYVLETRLFPTSSGRYSSDSTSGFLWGTRPISGNVVTSRLLLPAREKDNFYTVEYNKYINDTIQEHYNEFINEQVLYNSNDYTITPSSIVLVEGGDIVSGAILYVQRQPDSYIKIKSPFYSNDKSKVLPWQFQVSCGEFLLSSGIFGGNRSYYVSNDYVSGYYASGHIVNSEIPQFINKNIIKVGVTPLYTSGSIYPTYSVSNTILSGTINGRYIIDRISSIDYNNGYIYLKQDIKPTDSIQLTYIYDYTKTILAGSIDLNPKNTINANVDIALDSVGLVVVPSGTTFYNSNSDPSGWSYLAYYPMSDNISGDFSAGITKGYAVESATEAMMQGCVSGLIPSGSRLIGIFSLNSLSNDMVKVYDARKSGGYISSDIKAISGWRGFSDIGYWDGEPFPHAGTLVIQIPSGVYREIYELFDSNTEYTQQTSLYTPDLTRIIERDVSSYDSREQHIHNDVKKYIRDTIERYLPAGFLYIIVDENFNPWPSIRGES